MNIENLGAVRTTDFTVYFTECAAFADPHAHLSY